MLRTIQGFGNKYVISSDGRLYSKYKELTPYRDKDGYLRYTLVDLQGKRINRFIHRLVAEAFLPNPNNYKEINHIDENKSNNDISNLEWISRKGNVRHSLHNRCRYGQR